MRGVPERDISSLRTVAEEMTTQKNSSRRAAAVAPWKKTDSGIIGLVRPAGGHKISLKLINYYVKWTNSFF